MIPLLILIIWSFYSELGLINSYLLPSPRRVFSSFITLLNDGTLLKHTITSLTRIFVGFSIATILALSCAIIFHIFPNVYSLFESSIKFLQHLPPLAILSLLILWFGIGEKSKIVMIILASFFPIFINSFNGIKNCDPKLIDLGHVIQMNPYNLFVKIILPASFPYIILGMKLGLIYAWRSLIGAEFIATSSGLGYMILDARELSRSDVIIVGILSFGIIGILIDKIFIKILSKFSYISKKSLYEFY